MATIWIKESDWLTLRIVYGILIYSAWQGLSRTHFYTLPHNNCEVLRFHVRCLCVCPSVLFLDNINGISSKYQWIFTKLGVCIELWRSDLGLLIGKVCQFFTDSSAYHMIVAGYYHFTFFVPRCKNGLNAPQENRIKKVLWWNTGRLFAPSIKLWPFNPL